MTSDRSLFKSPFLLTICALLVVIVAGVFWIGTGGDNAPRVTPHETSQPVASSTPAPTADPTTGTLATKKPTTTPNAVPLRPLPVARTSANHEWSADDATSPQVIEKIAHNPDEFVRMVEENPRIQRRQLVYRKQPAWVLVESAKATGEPVRKLTLPTFDGQEVEMEVTNADIAPSGLNGTFAGKLAGREQSLVTLAFSQGREAFTVLSPEDGTFLQGHPREPGEIILTSFDPNTYQPPLGDDSIKTNQTFPIAQ